MSMHIDTGKSDPSEDRAAVWGSVVGVTLLFGGLLIAKFFLG